MNGKKNTEEAHFSFLKHNDKTWVPRVKHGWMDGGGGGGGWVGLGWRGKDPIHLWSTLKCPTGFFFLLYIRQKKKKK